MALILEGKQVAAAAKTEVTAKIEWLAARGIACGLAIMIVGDDPASHIYTQRLLKLAQSLGITTTLRQLPATATLEQVLTVVHELNADDKVHGILPMMPLPSHLDADVVTAALDPRKDIDALHPLNTGLVTLGKSRWAPCTPRAVMAILDFYGIELAGKQAVVIGRSNVVGKPVALLLLSRNATVTICHSKSQDLKAIVRQADIVVAAVGRPGLITGDMIKPGAVVIDVGINETAGKIVGDVDYDAAAAAAKAITPVPGGVGTVSNIMVMQALLRQFSDDV